MNNMGQCIRKSIMEDSEIARDEYGQSELHLAVHDADRSEVVHLIKTFGTADVTNTETGETPLHVAVRMRLIPAVMVRVVSSVLLESPQV